MNRLYDCHDCGAAPGEIHGEGCDTERCSVCGEQRLCCDCEGHDKAFARWTGIWPGKAEAEYLGVDLNTFDIKFSDLFFIKPKGVNDMRDWDDKVCSHCEYSIFSEEHKNTVPSIHVCLNPESEFYKRHQSWMCTCEKFEYKEN
jgi:hypothetical protein